MARRSSEAHKSSIPARSAAPSQPVSPPRNIAPAVAQASPMLGASSCKYKHVSHEAFTGVESMNLSMGKTLGSGTYAKVRAAYCHSRSRLMALKIVNKKVASADYLSKFLPREIELLRSVSHPYIIAAHNIIETEQQVFFLMDLAENGDLLDYINSRRHLPEHEARFLFSQITEGMKFLHSNSIAHRDLKCENILLGSNMSIKIADFGFGIDISSCLAKTPCGSYSYAAPELFCRSTDNYDALKADVWSMGVILFALVCGRLVFGDDNTVKKTQNRTVHFPSSIPLTEALKDLILCVLRKDATARLACHELARHIWMTSGISVKPASPVKVGSKYNYENLNIKFAVNNNNNNNSSSQQEPMLTSSLPVATGVTGHSGMSVPMDPSSGISPPTFRPSANTGFLSKLGTRISSAVKPRRHTSE